MHSIAPAICLHFTVSLSSLLFLPNMWNVNFLLLPLLSISWSLFLGDNDQVILNRYGLFPSLSSSRDFLWILQKSGILFNFPDFSSHYLSLSLSPWSSAGVFLHVRGGRHHLELNTHSKQILTSYAAAPATEATLRIELRG